MKLEGIDGIRIIESPHLTTEEVHRFAERSWRRFYRTYKVERIVYPKPDLYMVGFTAYAHPVVMRRLQEIVGSAGFDGDISQIGWQDGYRPVCVESWYVYDWTWVCWGIILFILAALVVLFS